MSCATSSGPTRWPSSIPHCWTSAATSSARAAGRTPSTSAASSTSSGSARSRLTATRLPGHVRVFRDIPVAIDPDEVLRFQGYKKGIDHPTADVLALFDDALTL